jgi:uncharacterized protein YjbI with pentapeptide repeats
MRLRRHSDNHRAVLLLHAGVAIIFPGHEKDAIRRSGQAGWLSDAMNATITRSWTYLGPDSDRSPVAGEQPRWAQCSDDGCIGVRLPNTAWCLAHAAEQASSAFDAELKRIGAEGTVDARGVVVSTELLERLLAAAPRRDNRPTFTAARFDRATFRNQTGFEGVTFRDGFEFSGATFQDRAGFSRATFHGAAALIRSGVAEAGFVGATFQGEAGFNEVTFQGAANFRKASFWGDSLFVKATFQGAASFVVASFQGAAVCDVATFHGPARYYGANFQGVARFYEASFQREADFDRVTFQDRVGFGGATFQGEAGFRGARFERAEMVGPLLARQLVLDSAVFGARVQLDITAATVCARRAHIPAGVHLRLRYAMVDLDDANLAAPAILAGAPVRFPTLEEEVQFARRWERLPPGPRQQRWRPRLMSVRRADVAGLHMADVDLRACRFAGAHNLDRLRIEGAPLLARTTGWWRARRKTLAEEQNWRANRPGRWRLPGWYPQACQPPASPKTEGPAKGPAAVEPARLAALYRELRKGREDAKDEPGAADFYYGECEMRRHDPGTPRAERLVLWLYWLVSGYALRASRAVLAWALLVVVGAAILAESGSSRLGPHRSWRSTSAVAKSSTRSGIWRVRRAWSSCPRRLRLAPSRRSPCFERPTER